MRRIQVIICSVDEEAPDDRLELDCFELPTATITSLKPGTTLDELETTTVELVDLHVVPHSEPRRHAGWPTELAAAVEAALHAEQPRPPDGVSWVDWERVLAARRAETTCSTDELRHLGPQVLVDEVLLTVDEVLTRRPAPGEFLDLRTARITTKAGSRYFSGSGATFLQLLQVAVTAACGILNSLLVIADGARWIRSFFHTTLAVILSKKMLLDWHHLQQKCIDLSSQICRKKATKVQLLRRLHRRLWRGDISGALALLEAARGEAKNATKLDELMAYLEARKPWIPNYRQGRIEQQYIGSGHVEKANDLIVARRQKNRGMQWSEATSDSLAGWRTLVLNGSSDRYWQHREVLPMVAA